MEGSKRERDGELAKGRPRKEDAPGVSAAPEGDSPVSRTLVQSPPPTVEVGQTDRTWQR